MKVLVLSTMVPFRQGNGSALFNHLIENLQATAGVEAEGFRLPVTLHPAERIIDEMSIARRLRLFNVDRLIALNFPTYLVPWHDKVLWLPRQYRPAYDLLDAGGSSMLVDDRRGQIVSAIRVADGVSFHEARRIYTVAPIVSERLLHYNDVASSVLRPPLNDPALFTGGKSDGYILAAGRINRRNRQHVLIRALRYSPGARLVITGPPDTPADAALLRLIVAEEGVGDRVALDLRVLPRMEMAGLINRALAVAYVPVDEDVLGWHAMGALQAGKPVLTVTDAGSVLDLVRDGESGLVVAPEPEALGAALARLTGVPSLARQLGQAGRLAMDQEVPGWPAAIERLLA